MNRDALLLGAEQLGIPLSGEQTEMLIAYAESILEQNKRINLTAVTDGEMFLVKHLLDSLTVAALPEVSGAVADVGTGGGFPGAVIAAYRPDCDVTLIDATEKKLRAVEASCKEAGINAKILHGRAEELGRDTMHRERFDTVVARAVAALPKLLEYCLPLVAVGGHLVAMKGPEAGAELALSDDAFAALGGTVAAVRPVTLPDGGTRNLIVVKKEAPTPDVYPRKDKRIQTKPL